MTKRRKLIKEKNNLLALTTFILLKEGKEIPLPKVKDKRLISIKISNAPFITFGENENSKKIVRIR